MNDKHKQLHCRTKISVRYYDNGCGPSPNSSSSGHMHYDNKFLFVAIDRYRTAAFGKPRPVFKRAIIFDSGNAGHARESLTCHELYGALVNCSTDDEEKRPELRGRGFL